MTAILSHTIPSKIINYRYILLERFLPELVDDSVSRLSVLIELIQELDRRADLGAQQIPARLGRCRQRGSRQTGRPLVRPAMEILYLA